ncbi:restriction endonuclease subunit S [Enterobacter hormaechei]|uniref:restriction endonuclease subunit S n=1 Tax=Enterobacter hormaechei TaxID=158836 RepID=UPI0018D04F88|nr:restriction endonuclease subunit S [Enterobacter hormaechei]UKK21339.1 restriction endonuclease subunit S [Enterobacter hormaechei]
MESLALMPKYESYKESGAEWLGDLPDSWELLSNKHIFTLKKKLVGKRSADYDLLSLTLRGIIKRDMDNPEGKFPAEFNTYQEVNCGDFVFCLFDVEETPRTVGLSSYDGMITGAYTVFQTNAGFDNKFLYYFYLNLDSTKRLKPLYRGLRNTIPKDSFMSFKTFVPLLGQQTLIANFLDKKTTQINDAITIKEQQINLLKERKQIIIQQAVTQGLDPNVLMKDSGVDWIGKIPAHWEVRRSKFVFTQRKERAWKDDVQLSATQAYGVIPQDQYEELTGKRVVKIQLHLDKRKHVEKDDFVISMRSFQGGLERAWSQGCIRSSYVVLRALDEIDPSFYGYLLKLPSYIAALQQTASFIRDGQDLNFDNFSKVDLFIPPIEEQKEIANYVSAFMKFSDEGIELLLAQIEKLKEYKTSLINSAVTGKIKITQEMVEQ